MARTITEVETDPMRTIQEIGRQWNMKDKFVLGRCLGRRGVRKCGRVWRIPQSAADEAWREMAPLPEYQPTRYDMKRVNGELTPIPRKRRSKP